LVILDDQLNSMLFNWLHNLLFSSSFSSAYNELESFSLCSVRLRSLSSI
jgi:hypothetical protein